MGLSDPSTVRGLEWLGDRGVDTGVPILKPERLAYVGLRDIDVYERKILRWLRHEHGLFASTMQVVVGCKFHYLLNASATIEEVSRRHQHASDVHWGTSCASLFYCCFCF